MNQSEWLEYKTSEVEYHEQLHCINLKLNNAYLKPSFLKMNPLIYKIIFQYGNASLGICISKGYNYNNLQLFNTKTGYLYNDEYYTEHCRLREIKNNG